MLPITTIYLIEYDEYDRECPLIFYKGYMLAVHYIYMSVISTTNVILLSINLRYSLLRK